MLARFGEPTLPPTDSRRWHLAAAARRSGAGSARSARACGRHRPGAPRHVPVVDLVGLHQDRPRRPPPAPDLVCWAPVCARRGHPPPVRDPRPAADRWADRSRPGAAGGDLRTPVRGGHPGRAVRRPGPPPGHRRLPGPVRHAPCGCGDRAGPRRGAAHGVPARRRGAAGRGRRPVLRAVFRRPGPPGRPRHCRPVRERCGGVRAHRPRAGPGCHRSGWADRWGSRR